MQTTWITGAAGFSGRHLARFLRTLPEKMFLVGLGRKPARVDGLDVYLRVDLTNRNALQKAFREYPPSAVFHLAGCLPPAPETDLWQSNVGGTLNLLEALAPTARSGTVRLVSIGSAAEYIRPGRRPVRESHESGGITAYGRTKSAQSALALDFCASGGFEIVIARTFNLIGPGLPKGLVPAAVCAQFAQSRNGTRVEMGNLQSRRDFIDVRDAVRAYWTLLRKGKPGEIYNVCSARSVSIGSLVKIFGQASGRPLQVRSDASRLRANDFDCVRGDNTKLRRLGWSPAISLTESSRDMLAHAGNGPRP